MNKINLKGVNAETITGILILLLALINELVGLHPKSHDMFWIYIKTTELEKAMNEWSSNNW